MSVRSRFSLTAAAFAAVTGLASFAVAADGQSAREPGAAPTAAPVRTSAVAASADLPDRRPLMSLLDRVGVAKPLDDARIQVYGHVEGSYTYNFANPPTDLADYKLPVGRFIDNPGRVFDVENQKLLLNQLTLNVERTVDAADAAKRNQWDVGGRVELMYGADARFLHSNGLLDHHDDDVTTQVTGGPRNQFDVTQAYVDLAIPVGEGLRVRAGKFIFFKNHDPNASVFYSHSFTFGAALPFTLTGAYATYTLNEQWSFDAGFSRGWDQSVDDNNGAIDVFGRVRYAVNKDLVLSLAAITGPEQDDDNRNYRTVVNLSAVWKVGDTLTLLGDAIYGQQSEPTGGGGDARWYGVALYAVQEITPAVSVAGRVEWYRDDGGYTTGLDQNLFEVTVGLSIRPFANDKYLKHLKIRPEVRWDYSNKNYFDGFDS
ncbi:MAG TPA: outer membrane beta-barrel protein, partial [Humisphaera sp.]